MQYSRGLTLVELLLAISMFLIMGALMFPISVTFLGSQVVNSATESLRTSLRQAELEAFYGRHDSAVGVKVRTHDYVLFEGDTFASRNSSEDRIFDLSRTVSTSGIDEVVFAQGTGEPSITGSVVVSADGEERTIEINSMAKIE